MMFLVSHRPLIGLAMSCMLLMANHSFCASPTLSARVSVSSGYRQDDLDWSIAGSSGGPNIAEELTFDTLRSIEFGVDTYIESCSGLVLNGELSIGFIVDGDNRDSDYLGDNKTLEFSRSMNSSDGDYLLDVSMSVGQAFTVPWVGVRLVPLVGFAFHRQRVTITDGVQVISPIPSMNGPIEGLDSWYQADWYGGWAGGTIDFRLFRCVGISVGGKYHWSQTFRGEGLFNLRSDAEDDFIQTAAADGITVFGALSYCLDCGWIVGLSGKYRDWTSDSGQHRTFITTPGTNLIGIFMDTPFNGANWQSYSVSFSVATEF